MKIFYIANARIPTDKAHGIQIMEMCEAFAANGLNVEFLVPKRKNPIKENAFEFYGVKKIFKIKTVYALDLLYCKTIARLAVHLQAITFALNVFFHVLLNPKKYSKDSIFYFRDEFSPWLLSLLNKKVFIEYHAFNQRFKHYKALFSRISGMILITKKASEEYTELGFKAEKLFIAPDGVDLDKFNIDISREKAREELNLPTNKKILCYTGIPLVVNTSFNMHEEPIVSSTEDALRSFDAGAVDYVVFNNRFLVSNKQYE